MLQFNGSTVRPKKLAAKVRHVQEERGRALPLHAARTKIEARHTRVNAGTHSLHGACSVLRPPAGILPAGGAGGARAAQRPVRVLCGRGQRCPAPGRQLRRRRPERRGPEPDQRFCGPRHAHGAPAAYRPPPPSSTPSAPSRAARHILRRTCSTATPPRPATTASPPRSTSRTPAPSVVSGTPAPRPSATTSSPSRPLAPSTWAAASATWTPPFKRPTWASARASSTKVGNKCNLKPCVRVCAGPVGLRARVCSATVADVKPAELGNLASAQASPAGAASRCSATTSPAPAQAPRLSPRSWTPAAAPASTPT